MKFVPRTLFYRNVLLLLGLFVLGLGSGALALRERVQKPRIAQLAVIVARQIRLTEAAIEALPPEHRALTRPWFNARSGGALLLTEAMADPPSDPPRMSLVNRQFLDDLRSRIPGSARDVRWSPNQGGTVWVRLSIGGQGYWFTESGVQLDGELPAAGAGLLLLVALLSMTGSALIQRRINAPLARLVSAATVLAKGEAVPLLSEDAPREIATVSRAFNQMTASLARMDADRTVVLAGVSHDLRTPLTKLRLAIEMLSKEGNESLTVSMLRSAAEMDAIIDQFLDYARAGSGEATRDADLDQLLRECVERYAVGGQVVLSSLDELPDMPLRVQSIKRAVENLIENALRYGGREVLIECKLGKETARVSVMDRGPGIPAGEMDALKKPFARGKNSAGIPGSGLGLAIVDRVIGLHFGQFTLLPRAGGGLEARIELPLSSG